MKKRVMKKRKTLEREKKEEEKDIISSLPEPILHHTLSFLPTNDAVKTSALSKTWNATWKSFPVIDFDQTSFAGHRSPTKARVQEFCEYVQSSITSRLDTSIEKFRAVVNFQGFRRADRKYLDGWLDFAIKKNVRNLVLDYRSKSNKPKDGWRYVLPPTLFRTSSSLESLDLFGCRFIENVGVFGFLNLKKLSLMHVYIDQESLQSLLSHNCRLLEELSIASCEGFEVVGVSNSPKLEMVDLYLGRGSNKVQIVAICSAPNLRSVKYGGNIASVKGSIMGSDYYESVKELKFHDTDVTDGFFRSVIPEFRRLEKLEIERCFFAESVRVSSDRLLELAMHGCYMLKQIELDTRCLTRFTTDGGFDVRLVR